MIKSVFAFLLTLFACSNAQAYDQWIAWGALGSTSNDNIAFLCGLHEGVSPYFGVLPVGGVEEISFAEEVVDLTDLATASVPIPQPMYGDGTIADIGEIVTIARIDNFYKRWMDTETSKDMYLYYSLGSDVLSFESDHAQWTLRIRLYSIAFRPGAVGTDTIDWSILKTQFGR